MGGASHWAKKCPAIAKREAANGFDDSQETETPADGHEEKNIGNKMRKGGRGGGERRKRRRRKEEEEEEKGGRGGEERRKIILGG